MRRGTTSGGIFQLCSKEALPFVEKDPGSEDPGYSNCEIEAALL